MFTTQNPRVLLIAERGADWPAWLERMHWGTCESTVIMQQGGESLVDLVARVRARLGAELPFDEALIACGGRTDSSAVSARSTLIRALVSRMERQGQGWLHLGSEGADRYALLALASTVSDMIRGSRIQVGVVDLFPARAA